MQDFISTFQKGKGFEMPEKREPLVCKPREVEPWRIFKIMSEFVEGFELLKKYGLAASFFGSARCGINDRIYRDAERLAGKLSKKGFAIITGAAQGVMQAANKGAFDAGGASVGFAISDVNEKQNEYLTEAIVFDHFFVRKVMLTYASQVYIYFPGGFGTLDEFFELITLIQTGKIKRVPIVLYDRSYWEPLLDLIKGRLVDTWRTVSPEDIEIYHLVDSVDEAFDYITSHVEC
jgi:uncharacterized protein (TIGR00730 family)